MPENYAFNNGSDFAQHIGNINNPDMSLGDWFRRFLMTPSEATSAGKYYDPSIQKAAAAQAGRAPQMGPGMETPDQANQAGQDAIALLAARKMRPEDSPEGGSYGPPPGPQAMMEAERPFYGPPGAPPSAPRRGSTPATPSAPAKPKPAPAKNSPGLAGDRVAPPPTRMSELRGTGNMMGDPTGGMGDTGFLAFFQHLFGGQGTANAGEMTDPMSGMNMPGNAAPPPSPTVTPRPRNRSMMEQLWQIAQPPR